MVTVTTLLAILSNSSQCFLVDLVSILLDIYYRLLLAKVMRHIRQKAIKRSSLMTGKSAGRHCSMLMSFTKLELILVNFHGGKIILYLLLFISILCRKGILYAQFFYFLFYSDADYQRVIKNLPKGVQKIEATLRKQYRCLVLVA